MLNIKKYYFDNDCDFLEDILKWNDNKNLVLWPLNIDESSLQKNILDIFYDYNMVDNIPYKIIKFDTNNEYKQYITKNDGFNVILSVLYLEKNIDKNYLVIRDGKLSEFVKTKYNSDIKVLELHLNINKQFYSNLCLKNKFKQLMK